MRRVKHLTRSSDRTRAYLVIHDTEQRTIEVWQVNPTHNQENVHCKTFRYDPAGPSDSAMRHARSLAQLLSRMSVSETLRQAENIRLHGEVR